MKKLLLITLIAGVLTSAMADISIESTNMTKTDKDKTSTYKTGEDSKDTDSLRESKTNTRDKTYSKNRTIQRNDPQELKDFLWDLEDRGIYPFSKCNLYNNPNLLSDFGLSGKTLNKRGKLRVNTTRQNLLEEGAKANVYLNELNGVNEKKVKKYANCVAYYAVLLRQYTDTDKVIFKIINQDVKKEFKRIQKVIKRSDCKLNGQLSEIVCGAVSIKIDYEPVMKFAGYSIYAGNEFYNRSATSTFVAGKSKREAFELSKSRDESFTLSNSSDLTINKKKSIDTVIQNKVSFSPESIVK